MLSTCSTVIERIQFGPALLAEARQRIGYVAVHQLAQFRTTNACYCSLWDALIWKMCTLAEFSASRLLPCS